MQNNDLETQMRLDAVRKLQAQGGQFQPPMMGQNPSSGQPMGMPPVQMAQAANPMNGQAPDMAGSQQLTEDQAAKIDALKKLQAQGLLDQQDDPEGLVDSPEQRLQRSLDQRKKGLDDAMNTR